MSSSLIAFSVACGYAKLLLFPYLFFVELFTMAVFLSGLVAGPAWGLWIGAVARLVFSVANPYGPPHPWILAAQIVGAGLVGALGGIARPRLLGPSAAGRLPVLLACGLLATLLYDALTNLAQGVVFGSFRVAIAMGALPALQHLASNLAIFAVAGELAIPWLKLHPRAARYAGTALAVLIAVVAAPDRAHAHAAPSDSTLAPVIVPAVNPALERTPAPPDTASGDPGRPIDLNAERKRGVASLEDVVPLRRAVQVARLPLAGPAEGSLRLPDGGGTLSADGWVRAAETATDEPWIGSVALGWGTPWLAFGLDTPRSGAVETLDLDAIRFPAEPGAFRAPGEALARPDLHGPAEPAAPGDSARAGLSRTTLLYQRGSGDAQLTGARFQTAVFHRELYASYSRDQADGWSPLDRSLTQRYALRTALGRWGSHSIEIEGVLFERSLTDSASGAGEVDHRSAALRASREGDRVSDAWRVGIAKDKQTSVLAQDFNVSPEAGSRQRWEFPVVTAEGLVSYRAAGALTWIGSFQAASRKIVYREGAAPDFEPRREEVRARLGARYGKGFGLDLVYDAREAAPGFLDGRASLWTGTGRARARVDLESAHERPSYVDLLTPASTLTFVAPLTFIPTELDRSGDPRLEPRRLSGGLGFLGLRVARGFDLELSGSCRRVTDDFGWDVVADTVAGDLRVTSTARRRGDGWLSHAAIGWALKQGPLRARGVAWIRGGPDSLSPQLGSPPKRALDAAAELRVVLFQGDLPLRFGAEAHARGPREGLIREPAQVTWDGTLSADFGSAGAFLRARDVFDRRPGSAIWDPAFPSGAPMPGRTFEAGLSWNLLD